MQRTVFVFLDDGLGNLSNLGFVKVIEECSYVEVRREIDQDELVEASKNFVFLGERNFPLTSRQEEKFRLTSNEVTIRLTEMHAPKRPRTVLDLPESQATIAIADYSENVDRHDSQPQTNNVSDHPPSNTRLQSKLASKLDLYKWQKAIKHTTAKMREMKRKDRFELMSRDVGGKAEFSIWCVECNVRYGKGLRDTMYNFVNSHCASKAHEQNCAQNHMQEIPTREEENEEDRRKENKSLVDHCLSNEVATFTKERGVVFKLYEPNVAGYAKLDTICIVCVTCEKTLHLFPKTGCLGQNLSDHITSNRHVHASMDAERRNQIDHEESNKGGRPRKSNAGSDPRQLSFLSFVTRATSSSSTIGSTSNESTGKVWKSMEHLDILDVKE